MKLKLHKGLCKYLFSISLCVLITNTVIAQSFERNNWYLDFGLGVGINNMNLQVKENVNEWKSGTVVLPFRLEYALLNQIGIGFIFKRNLYTMDVSGITSRKTSNSNSLLFTNNVHIINIKQFDFSISIQYGLGYLEQDFNYLNINRVIKGIGINYGADFMLRVFPTDNMAFFSGLALNNYAFDLLSYAENNERFNLKNQNRSATIFSSDFFVGITYHPLKRK
jgi:hypothetical protein